MTTRFLSKGRLGGAAALLLLLSSGCSWLSPFSGSKAKSTLPPVVEAVPKPVAAMAPASAAPPPTAASVAVAAPVTDPPPPAVAAMPPAASPPPLPTSIYFENDAYLVRPEFDAMLRAHAERLKANPQLRLQVQGHTDARGPRDYNRALAAKRAEMVIKALRSHGVDASQLASVALGKSGQAGDAGDRRVELVYLRSDSSLR